MLVSTKSRAPVNPLAVPAPKIRMLEETQTTNTFEMARTPDSFEGGRGFVDWVLNDAVAAALTAHENPLVDVKREYNMGHSIFEEMFQDWAIANPKKMAQLMITFAILNDTWLREVFPTRILTDSLHVVWNRFIVDREPAVQEVRNTGAKIISGYNEKGEMHMIYFAQMVSADRYRLTLEGGVAELNRRIQAMGENFNASVRLQTLKQIENTPYDMRAPEQLDPFRRLARMPLEVFQNIQSRFGMLDKDELGLEQLLAEISAVLGRGGRELAALIVKSQDYNAMCNKSGGRFFYNYSGGRGVAARAGGKPLPINSARDGSLLGVTIHQIPLLDMQMHNTTDGGILTATVSVGSRAPFLNDTHDCPPERYATNMRRIEFPSWETNEFDAYHIHECMAYDLAHFFPMENCHCGAPPVGSHTGTTHEHHRGGELNRPLLNQFCGADFERDTFDSAGNIVRGKMIEGSAVEKMEKAFNMIQTEFPQTADDRARIDTFLTYHPGREQWYPSQLIGEVPLELNPTELMLQSYRTMGRELLKGLHSTERAALELVLVNEAADAGLYSSAVTKITNNALRCTINHIALSDKAVFDGAKNDADVQKRVKAFIFDSSSVLIGGEAIKEIRPDATGPNNKEYVDNFYNRYGFEFPDTERDTAANGYRFGAPLADDSLYNERVFNELVAAGASRVAAHIQVYPLAGISTDTSYGTLKSKQQTSDVKLTSFAHRWIETFSLNSIEEQVGGRFYILQENNVRTYQINAKNNIANHNSGFVGRPWERQHMHSVVGTAGGALGKTYINPMGSLVTYEGEIKEVGVEQGLWTGTVIEKTDAVHIARNVRGGKAFGGKGKHFAVDLLKRSISGAGYNMMDAMDVDNSNNGIYDDPIVENTDQRMVNFGRYYYGRGDRMGNYSNFFFTQSANAGKFENYVTDVDICGFWDPAAFTTTLRHSHAFDARQKRVQWEGVALANFVYRFRDFMQRHRPFQNIEEDKYSYAQVTALEQNNTWLHTSTVKIFRRNNMFRELRSTHPWGDQRSGLFHKEQSLGVLNPLIQV